VNHDSNDWTRRRFVQGVAAGALLAGLPRRASASAAGAAPLSGTEFDLSIAQTPVNFTGRARLATTVNGGLPGPLLRWREGDTVTIRVTNRLTAPTSIHWHGIILPADMDGVPGLSFPGIPPGETFTYRFTLNQSGTYWYHAHSGFQEQLGLFGAIVVEPRASTAQRADAEHVILLSDWTDTDPARIYRTLKLQSDAYNYNKRTVADLVRDAREQGLDNALAERRMWGRMRMTPTDLLDVSGHVYTYLINGVTPADNWVGAFEPGQRLRLRLINAAAMSIFDVRIPGLKLSVVAADGQDVEPVSVDELRIAPAEIYDLLVEPRDQAYTLFAQSMDRTGFARGTLSPRAGLQAEVPAMDAPPLLNMVDMGMAHAAAAGGDDAAGAAGHAGNAGHAAHAGHAMPAAAAPPAPLRLGPTVDAVAASTRTNLDDPGVGLRGNGRRVLTYADLRTRGGPLDVRAPARDIELHLTGHMSRYIWSFNGQKFNEAEPLRLTLGERVGLVLINDSMMTHPIHLHGMWSELLTPAGEFQVRKHTVVVQPAQRIRLAVTAGAPGSWAFHCHLMFHMEAGMFRIVRVEPGAAPGGGA
jgi:CopA family copper-resistance protein